MRFAPRYEDVASEVAAFLEQRLAFAVGAGIDERRVCLDPGIGFGKTPSRTSSSYAGWTSCSRSAGPCSSASRASLARQAARRPGGAHRDTAASVGAAVAAYERGATILRVHDVREHDEALTAARAVLG